MNVAELKKNYCVLYNGVAKKVYYFDDDTVVFDDLSKAPEEDISGLPISDDILTRNGFKAVQSENNTSYICGDVVLTKINEEPYFHMMAQNAIYHYAGYVSYVHDVQVAFDAISVTHDWVI